MHVYVYKCIYFPELFFPFLLQAYPEERYQKG